MHCDHRSLKNPGCCKKCEHVFHIVWAFLAGFATAVVTLAQMGQLK